MSTIPIYIIYKITCVITDTSYIGQTSKKLKQRYKRLGKTFKEIGFGFKPIIIQA